MDNADVRIPGAIYKWGMFIVIAATNNIITLQVYVPNDYAGNPNVLFRTRFGLNGSWISWASIQATKVTQ